LCVIVAYDQVYLLSKSVFLLLVWGRICNEWIAIW